MVPEPDVVFSFIPGTLTAKRMDLGALQILRLSRGTTAMCHSVVCIMSTCETVQRLMCCTVNFVTVSHCC